VASKAAKPKADKPTKTTRRGHGEGTVFFREDKDLWVSAVTIGGKRRTLYGKTRKEVQDKKAALEATIIKGTYAEPSKVTVAVWLKKWLEVFVKPKRITTYENYECHVRVHILPALGDKPLQTLRPSDIQRFLNDKQAGGRADGRPGGLSTRTVRMLHFVLQAALKQAVKEGLIGKNVADDVALPKQGKRKAVYLVTEELEHFIEVTRKSRHFAAIMTEMGTGLRRGELLGLKWECVDLESKKKTITVRRQLVRTRHGPIFHEEPKTDAGYRTITLPDEVVTILKKHKAAQA
jgi:integrase